MAEGKEDAGKNGEQQARGGGAAEAEFAGRDDAEHVGVGLFAGADEEVEELGAAGGGVGGQLAGEGEFLGLADGGGEDVVEDVGVLAVGFGAAVGEGARGVRRGSGRRST